MASKTPKKDYESAKQKIADEYKGKSMKPDGSKTMSDMAASGRKRTTRKG
tara:strand:+ start:2042 stop:2191 length:150 start_codon:yes stop_codon:yes gene_type:complete